MNDQEAIAQANQIANYIKLINYYFLSGQYDLAQQYIHCVDDINPARAIELYEHYYKNTGSLGIASSYNLMLEQTDEVRMRRALYQLALNEQDGWDLFQVRKKLFPKTFQIDDASYWQGEQGKGGILYILGEQGLGDHIMMARYFKPLLEQYGFSEIVVKPSSNTVNSLFTHLKHGRLLANGERIELHVEGNYYCYLMDVAKYFDPPSGGNIPPLDLNLPPPVRTIDKNGRPDVAVIWQGNPGHARDEMRSISFDEFRAVLTCESVNFHCFQFGESADLFNHVPANCTSMAPYIEGLPECAQFLRQMDVVITVDSMPAHLAGSLGVETWLLKDFVADWRWNGDDYNTGWYPSMRLFKQYRPGVWHDVLSDIQHQLKKLSARS